MIIYKDAISGDEMFTDIYKMKLIDGGVYEVEGKMVTETTEVSDKVFGGNASADGADADEGATASSQSGCSIVLANRMVETSFTKKTYQTYIKGYMKATLERLEEENPERVAAFKASASKTVKKILGTFKDWQFFTGESINVEGMVALLNFREDGITPFMLFFKDGLIEEKA